MFLVLAQRLMSYVLSKIAQLFVRLITWLWDLKPGQVWYLDPRLDKFIFLGFSWIVWVGFMRRFGFWVLLAVSSYLDSLYANLGKCMINFWNSFSAPEDKFTPQTLFYVKINADGVTVWTDLPNPNADLDLSVTTDCEDLAAFASDVTEFLEQDRALLVDSLTDIGLVVGTLGFLAVGGRVISSRLFKRK